MKFPRLRFALALGVVVLFLDGSLRAAELKLASLFGDNMVLQQQQRVPVSGWCAPGAAVRVSFNGQVKVTHADAEGRWRVWLAKLKACAEPQSLVVEAGETITLTNILVGEVWLASGQSNMEKPLGRQPGQKPTLNAEAELVAANYPRIRLFKVEKALSATPRDTLEKFDGWRVCNSNALASTSFSAAAYFFGREIHTNLNVPVGLIESSWGGTRIEPWTPPAGFAAVPSLTTLAQTILDSNQIANTKPLAIYNAMIAPLAGFALRGALWYQGESNLMGTNASNDYLTYADKMSALVGGWRQVWGAGCFPFYFVQIAPFKYHGGKIPRVNSPEMLPEFWAVQARSARCLQNSGLVVTTDLVDSLEDIHPRDKATVGHRLALLALNKTYGQRAVVSSGPVFHKMKIAGNKVVLRFENVAGGLISKDGQPLTWFTIAGADMKFVAATARIVGSTVEVSAVGIEKPVAVRFAWTETAQPNFCNQAGLPAEPFRTDAPSK